MRDLSLRESIFEESQFALFFDDPSYDKSIIGVNNKGVVIYDYEKMINELSEDNAMSFDDAKDFIDYNTVNAYNGDYTPIIVFPVTWE